MESKNWCTRVLMQYLEHAHPELLEDMGFIEIRSVSVMEAYNAACAAGDSIETAVIKACAVMRDGLETYRPWRHFLELASEVIPSADTAELRRVFTHPVTMGFLNAWHGEICQGKVTARDKAGIAFGLKNLLLLSAAARMDTSLPECDYLSLYSKSDYSRMGRIGSLSQLDFPTVRQKLHDAVERNRYLTLSDLSCSLIAAYPSSGPEIIESLEFGAWMDCDAPLKGVGGTHFRVGIVDGKVYLSDGTGADNIRPVLSRDMIMDGDYRDALLSGLSHGEVALDEGESLTEEEIMRKSLSLLPDDTLSVYCERNLRFFRGGLETAEYYIRQKSGDSQANEFNAVMFLKTNVTNAAAVALRLREIGMTLDDALYACRYKLYLSGVSVEDLETLVKNTFSSVDVSAAPLVELQQDNSGSDVSAPRAKGRTAVKSDKLQDFGEHIAGARKDLLSNIASAMDNVTQQALVVEPLSKSFKHPNIAKLIEEGSLRHKDAIFVEAYCQYITSSPKPKVRKYGASSRRRDIETWAENTYSRIQELRSFLLMGEEERDRFMETLNSNLFPDREEEYVKFCRYSDKVSPEASDFLYTPSPVVVYVRLLERLGYTPGEPVKIKGTSIRPIFDASEYEIYEHWDKGAKRYARVFSLDDAVDWIVWANQFHAGDDSAEMPENVMKVCNARREYKEDGKWELLRTKGQKMDVYIYTDKEYCFAEAEKFEKKGWKVKVVPNKSYQVVSYGIMVQDPFGDDEYRLTEKEFETREEARSYMSEHHAELSKVFNSLNSVKKNSSKPAKQKEMFAVEPSGYRYRIILKSAFSPTGTDYDFGLYYKTWTEASKALTERRDELTARVEEYARSLAEINVNSYFKPHSPRIGEDYRQGKDVTPEQFMEMFHFRGVQFGNWTTGPDRQTALNEAYDAFMDLAALLHLSPASMSLGGELGLAFGARGGGNFLAHYECNEVVINLTRTKGAGSLAHEWFHAIDNYFGRQGKVPFGFLTHLPGLSVRPELRSSFNTLMHETKESSYYERSLRKKGDYWSRDWEVAARLFESWCHYEMEGMGKSNSFLVSPVKTELFDSYRRVNYSFYVKNHEGDPNMKSYEEFSKELSSISGCPYPTKAETLSLAGYMRNVFDTIREEGLENGSNRLFRAWQSDGGDVEEPVEMVEDYIRDLAVRLNIPVDLVYEGMENGLGDAHLRVGGWYDRSTDRISLYMPNIINRTQAARTLLHEGVAHFGLRRILGEEAMENLLKNVYSRLDTSERGVRDDIKEGRTQDVAEEYIAALAESGLSKPSLWNSVKSAVKLQLSRLRVHIPFSDDDIRVLLWQSFRHLTGKDAEYVASLINNGLDSVQDTRREIAHPYRSGEYSAGDRKDGEYRYHHPASERLFVAHYRNGLLDGDSKVYLVPKDWDVSRTPSEHYLLERGSYSEGKPVGRHIRRQATDTAQRFISFSPLSVQYYVDGKRMGVETSHGIHLRLDGVRYNTFTERGRFGYEMESDEHLLRYEERIDNSVVMTLDGKRTVYDLDTVPYKDVRAKEQEILDSLGFSASKDNMNRLMRDDEAYHTVSRSISGYSDITLASSRLSSRLEGLMERAGIQVEYYEPMPFDKDFDTLGYVKNGKIYLNRLEIEEHPETLAHEYTHLWAAFLRETDPERWDEIVTSLIDTDAWDEVLDSTAGVEGYAELFNYPDPDMARDFIAGEVLSREVERYYLNNGGILPETGMAGKIKDAVCSFWNGVMSFFGFSPKNSTSIQDVCRMVISDLLEGRDITAGKDSEYADFRQYSRTSSVYHSNALSALLRIRQEKASPLQWLSMLRNMGGLKADEDKWTGLSSWLTSCGSSILSRTDVENYIIEHGIEVHDIYYREKSLPESEIRIRFMNSLVTSRGLEFRDLYMDAFDIDWRLGLVSVKDESAASALYNRECLDAAGNEIKPMITLPSSDSLLDEDADELEEKLESFGQEIYEDTVYEFSEALPGDIDGTRIGFTTDGLRNYREIALTVPSVEPWKADDLIHFGDAGDGRCVAWIRMADGLDTSGNRLLVIDEIQSQRHQTGRDLGYLPDVIEEIRKIKSQIVDFDEQVHSIQADNEEKVFAWIDSHPGETLHTSTMEATVPGLHDNMIRLNDLQSNLEKLNKKLHSRIMYRDSLDVVLDAPFRKNWHELALKRAFAVGAAGNYDGVVWTTGEQQAERYSLGDKLSSVMISKTGEDRYEVMAYDRHHKLLENIPSRLDQTGLFRYFGRGLGKDMASRAEQEAEKQRNDGWVELRGEALRTGVSGMMNFYDQTLPAFAAKFCSKWNVSVEDFELSGAIRPTDVSKHGILFSEEMRNEINREGLTLFQVSSQVLSSDRTAAAAAMELLRLSGVDVEMASVPGGGNVSPVYTALFVQDRESLLASFPTVHPNIYADHITMAYRPGRMPADAFGSRDFVWITGRLQTDKVDVLLVDVKGSGNQSPHITLSTAEGVRPVESNTEIEAHKDDIVSLNAPLLEVRYGALLPGGERYYGDDIRRAVEDSGIFKDWFGDWRRPEPESSRIVDSNGRPLVVGHSSPNVFDRFDRSLIGSNSGDRGAFGAGFYFGTEGLTLPYGPNITRHYLNIRNPKHLEAFPSGSIHEYLERNMDTPAVRNLMLNDSYGKRCSIGEYIDAVREVKRLMAAGELDADIERERQWYGREAQEYVFSCAVAERALLLPGAFSSIILGYIEGGSDAFSEALQEDGFDGVIVDKGQEDFEYVAFSPEQIMSANPEAWMQKEGQECQNPEDVVYGWTQSGKIFLTPDGINPETPIHEYTHLWARAVQAGNPELWDNVVSLLDGCQEWQRIASDRNYSEIHGSRDMMASECLARLTGREGAHRLEAYSREAGEDATAQSLVDRMKEAVGRFWNYVSRDVLHIKAFDSKEDIPMQVLSDLVNGTDLEKLRHSGNNKAVSFETERERVMMAGGRNEPLFYSNAQRALESLKMEKAPASQWLSALRNRGGLKLAEDKWTGLSEWLGSKGESTLTRSEVNDYLMEHAVKVELVRYSASGTDEWKEKMPAPIVSDLSSWHRHGRDEGFFGTFWECPQLGGVRGRLHIIETTLKSDGSTVFVPQLSGRHLSQIDSSLPLYSRTLGDAVSSVQDFLQNHERVVTHSDVTLEPVETRMNYMTEGVEGYREIAITVPSIEPWNAGDELHFGDAGDGRCVAWLRFGEAEDPSFEFKAWNEWDAFLCNKADEIGHPLLYDDPEQLYEALSEADRKQFNNLLSAWHAARDNAPRIIVIDEIQSQRHQTGRKKGYQGDASKKYSIGEYTSKTDRFGEYKEADVLGTDGNKVGTIASDESGYTLDTGRTRFTCATETEVLNKTFDSNESVPDAPFRKNWHEVCMKVAMNYAATHGYSGVAWTSGNQQAERYNLGKVVDNVKFYSHGESLFVSVSMRDGKPGYNLEVCPDGKVVHPHTATQHHLRDYVGEKLSQRILAGEGFAGPCLWHGAEQVQTKMISGDGLVLDPNLLCDLYDKKIPQFMDKYSHKWGVCVESHNFTKLPGRPRMEIVRFNEEMRKDLCQAQPMFQIGKNEPSSVPEALKRMDQGLER